MRACQDSAYKGAFLGALLMTFSGAAIAQLTLYSSEETELNATLEMQAAVFGGRDSWWGESEEFLGAETDDWTELTAEAGLEGQLPLFGGYAIGEVSYLYTRTYSDDASGLGIGDDDPSKIKTEQGYVGWRSGSAFSSLDEDALTVKAGRFDYTIATGLLVADGGGDGGERGGWWIGARKAFKDGLLVSFDHGPWLLEGFHLKNRSRAGNLDGQLWGVNGEYEFSDWGLTLGTSYLAVSDANDSVFDDIDTLSVRADYSFAENWLLRGEYVTQDIEDDREGEAWWAQLAYTFADQPGWWSPELSYRYAHLSGDDPDTPEDERFAPLAYGFTDYGTWYQGEIAGNYPLENSNLDSHMFRAQFFPTADITVNLLYYIFSLDQQQIFGDPVDGDDFGDEINLSVDWAYSDNVFIIGTLGVLFADDAAESWVGGDADDDWLYSMLYVSYTF